MIYGFYYPFAVVIYEVMLYLVIQVIKGSSNLCRLAYILDRGESIMKESINKSIVVDSRGNLWVYSLGASGQIYYMVKHGRDEVIGNYLDVGGRVKEFFLDIDAGDNIHLIALTYEKEVVYMRYNLIEWSKHVLYRLSGTSNSISNLRLVSWEEELHLLYILSDPAGNSALFHHLWDGKGWKGFRVKDVLQDEQITAYDVSCGAGNIVYLTLSLKGSLVLWKFADGQWEKHAELNGEGFCGINDIVVQEDYLIFRNAEGVYFVMDINGPCENEPVEITLGRMVDKGPIIVNRKKTLHIAWAEDGQLKYRSSYDGGASWSRVKTYGNIQEEVMDMYTFVNNYSSLVKTKRVIATKPTQLHIPFIHRPMERVRFPQDSLKEAVSAGKSKDSKVQGFSSEVSRSFVKGEGTESSRPTPEDNKVAQNDTRIDELMEFKEDIKQEINELREGLIELRRVVDKGIVDKMDVLMSEIEDVKKKVECMSTDNKIAVKSMGNVITQEMINRHLGRRK
jgi:hypothetical protein